MPRYSTFALLLPAFLMLARPVMGAESGSPSLHPGDPFPQISGQTLTSKSLQLPAAASGRPAVVVFAFSKAGGRDTQAWNEHVSRDFSNAVLGYDVIVLELVPKLFRGMVVSGIRSSMPPALQDRTIVLYQDEQLWKHHLAVTADNRAYVVLLGPGGQVRWRNTAGFADDEYRQLKRELKSLLESP